MTRNAILEHEQVIKISLGADGAFDTLLDSGQQTMANSLPVVLASDQSGIVLGAGTAGIGKLTANSGVDIGDVDVTSLPAIPAGTNNIGDVDVLSLIPGTGATNLGKAIDTVTGATDTGVLSLATRDDALAALTPIEGDNVQLRVDANGALWVRDDVLDAAIAGSEIQVDVVGALPAGTNNIGDVDVLTLPALPAGTNNIGDVDVLTLPALPAGTNNIGDVDVLSIVPGTGATNLGKAIDTATGGTDTGVLGLATRDDALSALTPIEGDNVQLRVDANGALWTHDDVLETALSGSEIQVDVVAALPAGTNNIGDVDVLSLPALPAGTNNVGDVDVASIAAGDNNIGNVDVVTLPALVAGSANIGDVDVLTLPALPAGSNNIGVVNPQGYFVTVSTDVTRPADTTAYAVNDALSDSTTAPTAGGFTFTGAARASGGSGIITDAIVTTSADAAAPIQGEIWIFNTSVTNINDNSPFAVTDAEIKTCIGKIPFFCEDAGNNGFYHVSNLCIGFTCSGSANLRFLVRVKNAYAPASSEVLTFTIKCLQVT